jgi:hypothetical protein
MLTQELHQKCIEGLRVFLETVEAQQRIGFQDIVTGDESRIYLDTNPNFVWIEAVIKVPTRSCTMVTSSKQSSPYFRAFVV